MNILSIDQGTTNTKALLVGSDGEILVRASARLTTNYPAPGWVEQSANDIWQSVCNVIDSIVAQAESHSVDAIAIANQRETLVCWDAITSEPIAPAIVWQCRRSADICQRLVQQGHGPAVAQSTGLDINPLFPASKLGWTMRNVPEAKQLAEQRRLRAGTVDAWLIWKFTGGAAFVTDHSNASRTQLFGTETLAWSEELCDLFGVPLEVLPEPVRSNSHFGATAPGATALSAGVPIWAVMGDSHAALYGHGVRTPGAVKATFGTGSSLMTLTSERTLSRNGLSSTIAWSDASGVHHALEGNITVSAQALSFTAGMLGLDGVDALTRLAQTANSADGVFFVPALAGLGAPYWDNSATGLITGMSHGTRPEHLARAAFEAVAHQICDVFAAMEADIGIELTELKVDGGPTSNDFLMQLQADLLGRTVVRQNLAEVGALGVATMAFASQSSAIEDAGNIAGQKYEAELGDAERRNMRSGWSHAVRQAMTG